jgi:hypothetical protein
MMVWYCIVFLFYRKRIYVKLNINFSDAAKKSDCSDPFCLKLHQLASRKHRVGLIQVVVALTIHAYCSLYVWLNGYARGFLCIAEVM